MRLLTILLLLTLSASARAQLPAARGDLTQSEGGVTVRAKLTWLPPDRLKIEIAPDAAAGITEQLVVARGEETLVWEPAGHRLHRLRFNIGKEWWRGWNIACGGPANYLFSGADSAARQALYGQAAETAGQPMGGARAFQLKDAANGLRSVRDKVLFGGSGDRSYYAAYKIRRRTFPDWIVLGTRSEPATRVESSLGQLECRAQITLDGAQKWPVAATVRSHGRTIAYSYQLKALEEQLPDAYFDLPPAAAGAIIEDDELQAASSYTANDASAYYNRALALLAGAGDYGVAYEAFDEAAALAPRSPAPALAAFDTALNLRNLPLAARWLDLLSKTDTEKSEVEARRARLAIAGRDFAAAAKAIEATIAAAPQNLAFTLIKADVQRTLGDAAAARTSLAAVLQQEVPQWAPRVAAAEMLVRLADKDTAALLTGEGEVLKLARSLLALQNGKAPEATAFENEALQVSLSYALERAGRDEEARAAWTQLENRGAEENQTLARSHLVALCAARGDVAGSLRAWREWLATQTSETGREAANRAFVAAWQKNFRTDALRAALSNRALATGATSDDVRLWLTWQDQYGTPADSAAVVEAGAARFGTEAFWLSRRAEDLVQKALEQRGTEAGVMQRDRIFSEALDQLKKAREAEPDQPYYAMQMVLVLARRAATTRLTIDAGRATFYRNAARAELDRLVTAWPDDADVKICAALAYAGIGGADNTNRGIRLVSDALTAAPNDGDRYALVSAARQSLAAFLRTNRDPSGAAMQYELLLPGAASAEEEAGIAGSYLNLLADSEGGASAAAARLLARVAAENWPYATSRLLMDNLAARTVNSGKLAAPVLNDLVTIDEPGARLAEAALAAALFQQADAANRVEGAPPATGRALDFATKNYRAALEKLSLVASGPDRVCAARAAALLAENQTGAEAMTSFKLALAAEPREPALHLTLIDQLLTGGNPEEARAARDRALLVLPASPETYRRLGLVSMRLGDGALANRLAGEAFKSAQLSADYDELNFQRLAFAAARASFAAGNIARGAEIFNGLALPQWDNVDRAAALADLALAYQLVNRRDEASAVSPRITALGLSADDLQTAQKFLESIDD